MKRVYQQKVGCLSWRLTKSTGCIQGQLFTIKNRIYNFMSSVHPVQYLHYLKMGSNKVKVYVPFPTYPYLDVNAMQIINTRGLTSCSSGSGSGHRR